MTKMLIGSWSLVATCSLSASKFAAGEKPHIPCRPILACELAPVWVVLNCDIAGVGV